MKKITLILAACAMFFSPIANAQLSLLGHLNYTQDLSDIWGHVDTTGVEYALVGVNNGFSIVSLANPASPTEIQFVPGPSTIWRDIKTYNGYAYVTNEASGGMLIVDMTGLPASAGSMPFVNFDNNGQFTSAHNIFIDSAGYAYLFGADVSNGGALIFDLKTNPMSPTYVGMFDDFYLHDGMVVADTLWGSAVYQGVFAKIDISNKATPSIIVTNPTPNNFSHNAWISDDDKVLYTTDEVGGGFIGAYDVSDINNIVELDRWQSSPGMNVIPHNTHFKNDFLITSYYADGIIVNDVTYPYNIIQTGRYDSSPNSGTGFTGSWGAYPYLPSGNLLNADIEEGLDVIGDGGIRACYLEGTVTDANTSAPLADVSVLPLVPEFDDLSNLSGFYATGTVSAGVYDVVYSKPGYVSDTIAVTLANGVLVTQDVQLVPEVSFSLNGLIVLEGTSTPVANADVLIKGATGGVFTATSDASGNFTINSVFGDTYEITAGKWGTSTSCDTYVLSVSTNSVIIELKNQYEDAFVFDYGWSILGNATAGTWERGEPVGTMLGNDPANPEFDVAGDCGDQAYVTGNGGGQAGNDDVDGGGTHLFSPAFDISTYFDPYITYYRWFTNAGGGSPSNDSLLFYLSDGNSTVLVDFVTVTGHSPWTKNTIRVKDYFPVVTPNMTFGVSCFDYSPGHIVEGAFDNFRVIDSTDIGIGEEPFADLNIYPNPSTGGFSLSGDMTIPAGSMLNVYSMTGQLVFTDLAIAEAYYEPSTANGTYIVQLLDAEGRMLAREIWVKE